LGCFLAPFDEEPFDDEPLDEEPVDVDSVGFFSPPPASVFTEDPFASIFSALFRLSVR